MKEEGSGTRIERESGREVMRDLHRVSEIMAGTKRIDT